MRHLNPVGGLTRSQSPILAASSAFSWVSFTIGDSVTLQRVIVDALVNNGPPDLSYSSGRFSWAFGWIYGAAALAAANLTQRLSWLTCGGRVASLMIVSAKLEWFVGLDLCQPRSQSRGFLLGVPSCDRYLGFYTRRPPISSQSFNNFFALR